LSHGFSPDRAFAPSPNPGDFATAVLGFPQGVNLVSFFLGWLGVDGHAKRRHPLIDQTE